MFERVFRFRRRVEFAETDMAGIAHFTNYYKWVEAAEAALFEHLGVPLASQANGNLRGWPRVRAEARFKAPVHFSDTVEVELRVMAVDDRRLTFAFAIYNLGAAKCESDTPVLERALAARGEMMTCYVERPLAGGTMTSAAMPESWRKTFENWASGRE